MLFSFAKYKINLATKKHTLDVYLLKFESFQFNSIENVIQNKV